MDMIPVTAFKTIMQENVTKTVKSWRRVTLQKNAETKMDFSNVVLGCYPTSIFFHIDNEIFRIFVSDVTRNFVMSADFVVHCQFVQLVTNISLKTLKRKQI